jgi:hypothetical protein
MSPSDVARALTALIPTKRAVFLVGPPGVGKSSIVRQAANNLGLELTDVRATLLEPVDLRGLPRFDGDTVRWVPPDFLPKAGAGILFLDELSQSVPTVQAACLQLVLDRRIGEYVLPENWCVVAASNRSEDRAGTHRLISPLLNRFVHLEMQVSEADWQEWAVAAGIAPEVRAFIRYRPALLFQFEPASNPRAFPTPRSWEFTSSVLQVTPRQLLQHVVAGCVGEGPAAEFCAFLSLFQSLPDIDTVFANPTTISVPKEPSLLYALVGALVERVKSDTSNAGAFVKYSTRLPDEFGMLALRDALAADKRLRGHPEVLAWVDRARQKGLFVAA